MAITNDELKELFGNFQWIDDIPEDQAKRDEICLEAKATLLIEANCPSESFPAFIRWAEKTSDGKYKLPECASISCHETDYNYNLDNGSSKYRWVLSDKQFQFQV
ncbi:MAG: hypothetical protein IKA65_09800 [Lentisphaeria bacterium]|nr:hypothetical protein [Lentisphaeria bacterium]